MTQLQIREIQTRSFVAKDAKCVLKEMLNVLQDDAYIVKNADLELGFITGEKEIDIEDKWAKGLNVFSAVMSGLANQRHANSSWKKNMVLEVSGNVTQFGDDTRVRVNFKKKVFDNMGRVVKVTPIYDSEFYQTFFDKVHKGLFIQEEQI